MDKISQSEMVELKQISGRATRAYELLYVSPRLWFTYNRKAYLRTPILIDEISRVTEKLILVTDTEAKVLLAI